MSQKDQKGVAIASHFFGGVVGDSLKIAAAAGAIQNKKKMQGPKAPKAPKLKKCKESDLKCQAKNEAASEKYA